MKRVIMVFITLFLPSLVTYANTAYIPSHLEQFKQTGLCVHCDLSEATLYSHDNVNLSGTLLIRTNFSGHFYVSDFSHAELMYANMANIQASGSNFNAADLTGANLKNSNFSSSNFENAKLVNVNLANANLARSNMTPAQLSQAASIECTILPDGTRNPRNDGDPC